MTHKKSFKRIKKGKNAVFFFKFCHFIKKQKIDLPSKKNDTMASIHNIFLHRTDNIRSESGLSGSRDNRSSQKWKRKDKDRLLHITTMVSRSNLLVSYMPPRKESERKRKLNRTVFQALGPGML